eukprot:TRINITY_DN5213_c0_g1_i1.p1 TRINITY_DN5213_c0_g1~~TRINITY_DN5213_c0_g1_i1.p1  ORF type:complete len:325 (-),score=53.54 TRINITY_DN5213_c0_g1_i1:834-1712(-)
MQCALGIQATSSFAGAAASSSVRLSSGSDFAQCSFTGSVSRVAASSSRFMCGNSVLPQRICSGSALGDRRSSRRLVVEAKKGAPGMPGKMGAPGMGQMRMAPRIPEFDAEDKTTYFTIFIRGNLLKQWFPLNIVSGGSGATNLMWLMSSDLGKKLYQGTLTRVMSQSCYKDADLIIKKAQEVYPELRSQGSFSFGYKVLDKKDPKAALTTVNVIQVPPEAAPGASTFDAVLQLLKPGIDLFFPPKADASEALEPSKEEAEKPPPSSPQPPVGTKAAPRPGFPGRPKARVVKK